VFCAGLVYSGLENLALRAHFGNSVEVGARYAGESLYVDLAAFGSFSQDYITDQLLPSGLERMYMNVNSATTFGVELATGYTIRPVWLTPYVTGTWLRQEFDYETFSTWDTGRPEFSGRVGVRFEKDFARPGLFLYADIFARAASRAVEVEPSGVEKTYPGWGTANLALSASFGSERQYAVDLNLLNMFDKQYTLAMGNMPQAGIHVVVKARAAF